jgi:chromosome segregation ATPase
MDQELVQYLDERFGRLDERLDERFGRIDQRFSRIDERFDGIEDRLDQHDQRFDRIEQRLDRHDERFDEVKRHTGVLVEGLRHELQLVAEGLVMHIQVQHVQEREYHDRQHQETRALIRSMHVELRQQDDQLGQRVENLERQRPN